MIRRTRTLFIVHTLIWDAIALTCTAWIAISFKNLIIYEQTIFSDGNVAVELVDITTSLDEARIQLDSLRHAAPNSSEHWSLDFLRRIAAQFNLRLIRVEPGRGQNPGNRGVPLMIAWEGGFFDAMNFLRALDLSAGDATIYGVSLSQKNEVGNKIMLAIDVRFDKQ